MPRIIGYLLLIAELIVRCLPGIVFLLAACLATLCWAAVDGILTRHTRRPPAGRDGMTLKREERDTMSEKTNLGLVTWAQAVLNAGWIQVHNAGVR